MSLFLLRGVDPMPETQISELNKYKMFIGGEWINAENDKFFESVNPTTNQAWALIPEASANDVDKAVKAAHYAFKEGEWGKLLPTQRGEYLRKLADLLAQNAEKLGEIETIDSGKMFKETRWQAKYIAQFFNFYAGCADKISGETLPLDRSDMIAMTTREPLGVVAAIVPWNSQLFLVAVKLGPALAAGNTVVLKASEFGSVAMLEFAKLIEEAGFPKGVVNVVTGHGEPCGAALTSHKLVRRISFTGGPNAARYVLQNSCNNFAEVSLELGGKSPFIVFDDANFESAVNGAVAAIFGATGQSCVAGSRLYLQDTIADKFLEKMVGIAKNIKIGDPMAEETQMGPLCTEGQLKHIKNQVALAIEEGGKLLCGGKQPDLGGLYFEPTIIECPDQKQTIMDTELFGPVLSVHRFKTEEEVIKLANDTTHGLAAGIFSQSATRSLRVSRAIEAGIVWVNTYRVVSPIVEFGGFKDSGYGRESGFQAMYDYTRPKSIWMSISDEPLGNPFVMR